jgi:ligand-binding SRPBCC domain-containing protein
MRPRRIEITLLVDAPAERVFDLARSVDAHVASTPGSAERVVGGKMEGLLGLGDEVTWEARHLGVRQRLTSRITGFDRPSWFRDSMVKGAFASFDHDHFFERVQEASSQRTRCRDVFTFRAPFGPFGRVVEVLFLERYMRRFLEKRLRILQEIAENIGWERWLR